MMSQISTKLSERWTQLRSRSAIYAGQVNKKSVFLALVAAALSVGASFVGLIELPVVGDLIVTFILFILTTMILESFNPAINNSQRLMLQWATIATLAICLVGAVAYIRLLTLESQQVEEWQVILDGASEAECLNASGEPGGEPLRLDGVRVCGLKSIAVECSEELDGLLWLRLSRYYQGYWVPADAFRPRAGTSLQGLPSC